MLLIKGDSVGSLGIERWIGAGDESTTNGHFRGETNHCADDVGGYKCFNGVVDIARVDSIDCTKDDEDFAGSVGGSMAWYVSPTIFMNQPDLLESPPSHIQRVL